MPDLSFYQKRREALKRSYLPSGEAEPRPLQTAGVDHLAVICSELERTIGFYAEVLGMRLTQIVQNRDEPTSTHIFFDMGGGNQLAFFDFPEHGPGRTVRGEVTKGGEWDSLKDIFLKKNPFEAPFFGNPALRMVRVKPKRISYTGADMQGFKTEAP